MTKPSTIFEVTNPLTTDYTMLPAIIILLLLTTLVAIDSDSPGASRPPD